MRMKHAFHIMLIWLVVPSSIIALTLGCKKHKDKTVFAGITLGLFLLVFTAFFGHDIMGEFGEKAATIVATIILAVSHFRNFSLCRKKECVDACHQKEAEQS